MSSVYDEMRVVAAELMDDPDFKQGVVRYISYAVPAGTSPDEGGEPVATATVLKATVRPVSTKYVDGSHIVQSDRQVTVANTGTEPSMEGSIEIDGVVYKIIEIMPRPAAGTPVVYTVIVRR
jgi:hypothetical protein